jgi:hypothetical protein
MGLGEFSALFAQSWVQFLAINGEENEVPLLGGIKLIK